MTATAMARPPQSARALRAATETMMALRLLGRSSCGYLNRMDAVCCNGSEWTLSSWQTASQSAQQRQRQRQHSEDCATLFWRRTVDMTANIVRATRINSRFGRRRGRHTRVEFERRMQRDCFRGLRSIWRQRQQRRRAARRESDALAAHDDDEEAVRVHLRVVRCPLRAIKRSSVWCHRNAIADSHAPSERN